MTGDRQRRVLVVSTSYPLRSGSTSGVFVARLVGALTERFDMTVLCPADTAPEPFQAFGAIHLVAFRYAPRRWQRLAQSPGGVLPSIKAMPGLMVLLPVFLGSLAASLLWRARSADVVHANWAICGALAGALRAIHRKPVVVTLRGDDVTVASRSFVHRKLLELAVSRATAVVCVAESMASRLRECMPAAAAKISVALNGVGAEFTANSARNAQRVNPARFRMVSIGSLIVRKGVADLLRAVAMLRRQDVELQIAGDGPERAHLEALAVELSIEGQVEFLGQLAPDEIPALLACSDIFVLPSHSEGRPNVLLEAMAAGLPIVATRIAGVVDTVIDGQHAWLVEAGDSEAIAAALADVLDRPEEGRRRSEAARFEVVERGWTWSATADVYAQLFERIVPLS